MDAVDELYEFVDFYKIASYELLWNELLTACAQTGKPVVISTGMATLDEVKSAVDILAKAKCKDLTILHCVSGYPAPINECNLAAIKTLRSMLSSKLRAPSSTPPAPSSKLHAPCFSVGWSDHSVNPGVIHRAIHRWNSEMIEFHLDLDGTGEEYKTGHCWLPEQIKEVIDTVKAGLRSDGTGKKIPAPSELPDRDWRADPQDGLRPLKHIRNDFDRITG
jgi:N-acetylneuraminate synthase